MKTKWHQAAYVCETQSPGLVEFVETARYDKKIEAIKSNQTAEKVNFNNLIINNSTYKIFIPDNTQTFSKKQSFLLELE